MSEWLVLHAEQEGLGERILKEWKDDQLSLTHPLERHGQRGGVCTLKTLFIVNSNSMVRVRVTKP